MADRVVFVVGGTKDETAELCDTLQTAYNCQYMTVHELLAAEQDSGSEQGALIGEIRKQGEPVPPEITIGAVPRRPSHTTHALAGLLKAALDGAKHAGPVLIDDFPRDLEQATAFESNVGRAALVLHVGGPAADDGAAALVATFEASGRAVHLDGRRGPQTLLDAALDALKPLLPPRAGRAPPGDLIDLAVVDAGSAAAAAAAAPPAGGAVEAAAAGTPGGPAAGPPRAATQSARAAPDGAPWALPEPLTGPKGGAAQGRECTDGRQGRAQAEAGLLGSGAVRRETGTGSPRPACELRAVVIVGPSGVGKGTIIAELMRREPGAYGFAVSHTTRARRGGEAEGGAYHFVDAAAFEALVAAGAFLEHADVHGARYGTSAAAVAAVSDGGRVALLDIDVQGARQVRASALGADALVAVIEPPSMDELERRLRGRGTEDEAALHRRLAAAAAELEAAAAPGLADVRIVNVDVKVAVDELQAAIARRGGGAGGGGAEGVAPGPHGGFGAVAHAHSGDAVDEQQGTGAGIVADDGAPLEQTARVGSREYLNTHVVPHLREALLAVAAARPPDALAELIEQLTLAKARRDGGVSGVPADAGASLL